MIIDYQYSDAREFRTKNRRHCRRRAVPALSGTLFAPAVFSGRSPCSRFRRVSAGGRVSSVRTVHHDSGGAVRPISRISNARLSPTLGARRGRTHCTVDGFCSGRSTPSRSRRRLQCDGWPGYGLGSLAQLVAGQSFQSLRSLLDLFSEKEIVPVYYHHTASLLLSLFHVAAASFAETTP